MAVVVVDYGMGNVGSIANMIRKVGGEAFLAADAAAVAAADKLVLPGVGAFDQGMRSLDGRNLIGPLRDAAARGVPILGICLGMQLMMEHSDEGSLPGFALVPGRVKRFPAGEEQPRVPHMGWNRIALRQASPLFTGSVGDCRYYFVHSYYVSCTNSDDVIATTSYGSEFVSVFQRNNLFGVQFHPEKSHRFGMALFRSFLSL